jgi:hypothetical protein
MPGGHPKGKAVVHRHKIERLTERFAEGAGSIGPAHGYWNSMSITAVWRFGGRPAAGFAERLMLDAATLGPTPPFSLAAQDNILYAAGLRGGSVGDVQRFFELSRQELAEFSSVCGGSINSNERPNALGASPSKADRRSGA